MNDNKHYQDLFDRANNIPVWNFIGSKLIKLAKNYAEVKLPFQANLMNERGFLQGGMINVIADSAGGWALLTTARPEAIISTLELKVNYLKPIKEDVIAEARVLHLGYTIGTSEIKIKLTDGTIAAVGIGTYYFKG